LISVNQSQASEQSSSSRADIVHLIFISPYMGPQTALLG
jgi:hypothetical protein